MDMSEYRIKAMSYGGCYRSASDYEEKKMFKYFVPRFSWIFTIIAAFTMAHYVEPWDWKTLFPFVIVWMCGMISGLMDGPALEKDIKGDTDV